MKRWVVIGFLIAALMMSTEHVDRARLQWIVQRWGPKVRHFARQYGIPEDLVLAIIYVESRGNPDTVGSSGDTGLMQIRPIALKDVGLLQDISRFDPQHWKDPDRNIMAGVRYLHKLATQYLPAHGVPVTYENLARAYNGGPMGWKKASTIPYGRRVMAAVKALKELIS